MPDIHKLNTSAAPGPSTGRTREKEPKAKAEGPKYNKIQLKYSALPYLAQ